METNIIDLSLWQMTAVFALLIIPAVLLLILEMPLWRPLLFSVGRMSLQLVLVGLYLGLLFHWNNLWLNLMWVAIMLLVANYSIVGSSGLRLRQLFWPALLGVGGGTALVIALFVVVILQPQPLFDARYLVPIAGMVLGNCLRGNVVGLERFYAGLRRDQEAYLTRLLLGATRREALRPHLRDAVRAALTPMIASMATMGLVSLPGMMTGQILGGSMPMLAIKYQIAIMIVIFTAMTIAVIGSIVFTLPYALTPYDMPRSDIYREA